MSETTAGESLMWVKSTRSAANGDCVEMARIADGVAVRDSKDPRGPVLTFGSKAWIDFLEDVRTGSFD